MDTNKIIYITVPKEGAKSAKDMETALKQVDIGVRGKDKDLQTLKKALQLEEQNLQKDIDRKRYNNKISNTNIKVMVTY